MRELLIRNKSVFKAIIGFMITITIFIHPDNSAWASNEKFKVCADGNYLPMSNKKQEGFENRIAQLFADQLGKEIAYYWFPQRLGFIRNTLRKKNENGESLCDVVIGVPDGYELVKPTKPWYRSSYAFVYVRGRGFDSIKTSDDILALPDDERKKIRFGMHERNPGVRWLSNNAMLDQLEPYIAQLGDPNVQPGELEGKDLIAGNIDMAVLWGPLAGELKRATKHEEVVIVPIKSEPAKGLVMDYAIAMGVHFPNGELAKQLNQLIENNREEIAAILSEYHVPLIEPIESANSKKSDEDDDDDD